jgi:transcriptional regulator with XRE-family HTH domain
MNDLHSVFAKNIADLRAERKMTQAQLAAVLNYSDKAISKWERGEALPDVTVVKQIADIFGVSVDYLLQSEHKPAERRTVSANRQIRLNRLLISAIATTLVWLIATFLFLVFNALPEVLLPFPTWLFFVYSSVPSLIVILVFNSIWGNRRLNFAIISALVWSLLATVFLSIFVIAEINLWQVFLFGIPSQCIIMLWSGLKNPQIKKEIRYAPNDAAPPSELE